MSWPGRDTRIVLQLVGGPEDGARYRLMPPAPPEWHIPPDPPFISVALPTPDELRVPSLLAGIYRLRITESAPGQIGGAAINDKGEYLYDWKGYR